MTFEEWMRYRGLSEASVKKYGSSITGVMSDWAVDGGLMDGPLTSIQSHSRFESIANALRLLPIYQRRNDRGHNMYSSALNKYAEYLQEGFDNDIEADVESILAQSDTTATEKASLIKTRIGQGKFRQRLIAYWDGCAVTGYKDPAILIASHIKPWTASSNAERVDQFNGLLLLPTLDKAFDAGFITFDVGGKIQISPKLQEPEALGVSNTMTITLDPRHHKFIQFHREHVFQKE